jgi:hypothetical protein
LKFEQYRECEIIWQEEVTTLQYAFKHVFLHTRWWWLLQLHSRYDNSSCSSCQRVKENVYWTSIQMFASFCLVSLFFGYLVLQAPFVFAVQKRFWKNLNFFFLQINFLWCSYRFDILMSKMKKNIILLYFQAKNILKSNHYHNVKRAHRFW